MFNFLNYLAEGTPNYEEYRNNAITTNIGGQTVDTVFAGDEGKWETGIERDGEWIIVEQYDDKNSAENGHKKWVNKLKKSPKIKLKDINLWGL